MEIQCNTKIDPISRMVWKSDGINNKHQEILKTRLFHQLINLRAEGCCTTKLWVDSPKSELDCTFCGEEMLSVADELHIRCFEALIY